MPNAKSLTSYYKQPRSKEGQTQRGHTRGGKSQHQHADDKISSLLDTRVAPELPTTVQEGTPRRRRALSTTLLDSFTPAASRARSPSPEKLDRSSRFRWPFLARPSPAHPARKSRAHAQKRQRIDGCGYVKARPIDHIPKVAHRPPRVWLRKKGSRCTTAQSAAKHATWHRPHKNKEEQ